MQESSNVLVVSAGFRPELLETPRKMGLRVALVDERPPADGALYDDFLPASATDEDAVVHAVKRYLDDGGRVDAVACVFDGSIHAAAAVCDELGLPGNSREAVRNMRDKYRSWQVLSAAGLPVPLTALATSEAEAVAAGERIGYPLVMKPQASAASQGVVKVNDRDALVAGYRMIAGLFTEATFGAGDTAVPNVGSLLFYPGAHGVLLQEYVEGFELSLDVVYTEDAHTFLGYIDKPQVWAEPYFAETVFVSPTHLPAATQRELEDITVRALRASGATVGAAHVEFRISPAGPKIIEVNGRIGGPSLFVQESLHLAGGVWGPEQYFSAVTGRGITAPTHPTTTGHAGFTSVPVVGTGRIARFEGEAEVRAMPGVRDIRWVMREGQYVPEGFPRNPSVMFAHILATGPTHAGLADTLTRAQQTLRAVMEP
ncbi:ATP-grasp domain-containing protein [Actinokineospora auranticolor]|uniref:Biotin carboxylase n=1 Tax=Actinokineospora auranticolor TaxID=155976 RepID=A0A2S6H1F9_9PSEU|nr:ATP-grasp domain-containing protein [Actinokineospora auranticolor]PPK71294.1 biotin carboxylase [Actinokineospora auranticolor]